MKGDAITICIPLFSEKEGGVTRVSGRLQGMMIEIEASKIRAIRFKGSAAPGDDRGQVKSLEDKMLGDSEIMDSIRALQNDPDFQKILQDPEIMKRCKLEM
jgi:hypothetical protein